MLGGVRIDIDGNGGSLGAFPKNQSFLLFSHTLFSAPFLSKSLALSRSSSVVFLKLFSHAFLSLSFQRATGTPE